MIVEKMMVRAQERSTFGRKIAEVLCQHGIVNNTPAVGEALVGAMQMVAAFAAGSKLAIAMIKSLISVAPGNDLATQLEGRGAWDKSGAVHR